ncbi:hypothetical protein PIB30_010997 [Stylosanthes scabra]|uniref:Uncharacterized protein n=1 Tax=Stylosanthes scabra TaxID=79078 RepID=A0ABU6V429_9FABA|nr:hypothetical protein [Stylosanthes scabra]
MGYGRRAPLKRRVRVLSDYVNILLLVVIANDTVLMYIIVLDTTIQDVIVVATIAGNRAIGRAFIAAYCLPHSSGLHNDKLNINVIRCCNTTSKAKLLKDYIVYLYGRKWKCLLNLNLPFVYAIIGQGLARGKAPATSSSLSGRTLASSRNATLRRRQRQLHRVECVIPAPERTLAKG